MRILKIVLVSVFVLALAAVIGVYILLKAMHIEQYKPQIIAQGSALLGRQVGLGDIGLNISFKNGIGLNLKNISIADDPAFATGNFFQVQNVYLNLDLLAFLKTRTILFSSIQVKAPRITIIKNQTGLNVATIGKKPATMPVQTTPQASVPAPAASSVALSPVTSSPPATHATSKASSIPPIVVQKISVENAAVFYTDQTTKSPLRAEMTHLNLIATIKEARLSPDGLQDLLADVQITDSQMRLKDIAPGISFVMRQISLQAPDFSLNAPFNVKSQVAYASDIPNIFLQTGAQMDLSTQTVTLKNLSLTTDLSSFSIPQLQSSIAALIAALKDVIFPEYIRGKVQLIMAKLEAGAKGVGPISGEATLTNGSLKLKQLGAVLDQIQAKIVIDANAMTLKDFSLELAKGKILGTAKLTDYLQAQTYSGQFTIDGIDLSQVLAAQQQPVQLEGALSGKATFEGMGLSPEAIRNALSANSHFAIANGRLKDINILQLVVSKLEEIPTIGGKLQTSLPASYQQALEEKDTVFQKIDLTADVKNGQLVIEPFEMAANGFIFIGQGTIGFDQRLDLKGSFEMASDLSRLLVQAVPNLQYLNNAQQLIEFPMVVTGTVARPRPLPDFNYITKRAIINEGKKRLEKLISKYLPVSTTSTAGNDQSQSSSDQQQQNENPTGKAIDTILSNFFK